jgi:hypothetical protein
MEQKLDSNYFDKKAHRSPDELRYIPLKIFKLTKINFMSNQKKNPVFICLIILLLGVALGVWGWIKGDCNSSPECFVGSGFLKWTGGILIVAGLAGWALLSNRPKRGS